MPTEYEQFINQYQINPSGATDYDEFVMHYATPKKTEERGFIAKHPNLYGAFGVAQELIPYLKYVDPSERERFAKLSTQKQTRELLLEDFNLIGYMAVGPITKGVGKIGGALVERFLPKTYKTLKKISQYTPWKGKPSPAVQVQPAPPVPTPQDQMLTEGSPVQKITSAIKEAKSKRKVQELLYTQARRERFAKAKIAGEQVGGEKGYYAQLKEMKGELPKVEFEAIRSKIGQEDINSLFNIIRQSITNTGDQLTAQRGLAKLFGELGGTVPTEGELKLLGKVFPQDFIRTLLSKRPLIKQMTEAGYQLANIPRSIMSSFDLSAPLRQGLFISAGHPVRGMQSFLKMFRQFGSEQAFQAVQESITKKASYNLMKESGLSLTEMGQNLLVREERFMSQWAEKIPLVGRGVRASGRAYMGFLNKLRADVFDDLAQKASKLGLDPQNNMKLTKEIAKFVNAASGRGGLGALENSAVELNTFFFSPRLIASRLTLLNPIYYVKADPFVRKEALKCLFATAGAVGTTLGLAKVAGVEVGTDWRSADFGKIKIHNTRIDIMGGFQQYIRAAGQLISGQYVSSTTGKVVTLGEGYRPLTRYEIALRQLESKEAPIFSFITTMLKGQDIKGEKIKISKEIADRFTPMAIQDIIDIAKEDPELLPISALGMFGVGLQTYGPTQSRAGGIEGIGGIGK